MKIIKCDDDTNFSTKMWGWYYLIKTLEKKIKLIGGNIINWQNSFELSNVEGILGIKPKWDSPRLRENKWRILSKVWNEKKKKQMEKSKVKK